MSEAILLAISHGVFDAVFRSVVAEMEEATDEDGRAGIHIHLIVHVWTEGIIWLWIGLSFWTDRTEGMIWLWIGLSFRLWIGLSFRLTSIFVHILLWFSKFPSRDYVEHDILLIVVRLRMERHEVEDNFISIRSMIRTLRISAYLGRNQDSGM